MVAAAKAAQGGWKAVGLENRCARLKAAVNAIGVDTVRTLRSSARGCSARLRTTIDPPEDMPGSVV